MKLFEPVFLRDLPIRGKLTFLIVSVAAVSLLIAGFLISMDQWTSQRAEVERDMEVQTRILGLTCAAAIFFGDAQTAHTNLAALRADNDIQWAAIYDTKGRIFASYRHNGLAAAFEIPEELRPELSYHETGNLVLQKPLSFRGQQIGYIVVSNNLHGMYHQIGQRIGVAIVVVALAVLFAFFLAAKVQRLITEPILSLTELVGRVSRTRDYSARAEASGTDEVGRLMTGFNHMLEQIQNRDILLRSEIEERIATEESLVRSREQYQTLFEHANDAILVADTTTGIIIDANRKAHELLGVHPGTLRGRHQSELHPPEEQGYARTVFQEHSDGTSSIMSDLHVQHSSGRAVPVEISAATIRFGDRALIFGVFRDLTERQNALQTIRKSEEQYRGLVESIPDGVEEIDREGTITYVNPAYCAMLKRSFETLIGRKTWELIPEKEDRDALERYIGIILEQEPPPRPYFHAYRMGDGSAIDVQVDWNYRRDDAGRVTGFISVITDITEKNRAEQAIRESEERFRSFTDMTNDMIFILDPEHRVVFANPATTRLLGYPVDEFLGENPLNLFHADDALLIADDLLRFQRDGINPPAWELRLKKRDGGYLDVEVSAFSIDMLRDERYSGAIVRDITQRKTMEKSLRFSMFAVEHSQDAVFWVDHSARFTYVNESACNGLGYTRDELIGLTIFDVDPAFSREMWSGHWSGVRAAGGRVLETFHRRKDGSLFPVEVSITNLEYEGQEFHCAFARNIEDRKEKERLLRKSEERFRALAERSPDMIHLMDSRRRFTYANSVTETLLGYSLEEFLDMTVDTLLHPDERDITVRAIEESFAGTRSHSVPLPLRLRKKDGTYIDVEVNPFFLPVDDESAYLGGILRDVTERKKSAVALARSEERYRLLFKESPIAILEEDLSGAMAYFNDLRAAGITDMGTYFDEHPGELQRCAALTKIVSANTQAIRLFRASTERDLVDNISRVFAPQSMAVVQQAIVALFNGATEFYADTYNKTLEDDLLQISLTLNVAPGHEDTLEKVVVSIVDITDRKKAEELLRQSEHKFKAMSKEFHSVLEAIRDPLLLLNHKLEVVWANHAALAAFPKRPNVSETKLRCFMLCYGKTEPCAHCPVLKSFSSGQTETDVQVVPDGLTWSIRAFPIVGEEGTVKNVIKVMTDISEKVRLEDEAREVQEKLVHTNKMTALGTLVAGIAHEISNPNNTIMFNAPLLMDAWNDAVALLKIHERDHGSFLLAGIPFSEMSKSLPSMVRGITESSSRIARIVASMRDFARRDPEGEFTSVDLNEAARVSMMILSSQVRKYTDHFSLDLQEDLPPVRGNLQQIEQIAINLILNALQSLPDKSRSLGVSTGHDPEAGLVELRVSDQGTGIAPETLARITEPFFTTKHASGGMGLGLSISDSIAKRHGGALVFSSGPGEGTTAILRLPTA